MIQRFKIDDLVIQDGSGVVFKAVDETTGQPVFVRRFFPFGADGGGLNEAMQAEYYDFVARLAEIKHPALCSVVEGGCDPVDGMPYLVTEWMEGTSLETFLESRPLSQPEAIALIIPLMEVCQLLSQVTGHEGIWVDTDFSSITLETRHAHRPVTFQIAPLKCYAKSQQHCGLYQLVELTAHITGWYQGVPEHLAAAGLGAWLNWLHGACESATIHEALKQLTLATGAPPPSPVVRKTRPVTPPGTNAATRALLPARPVKSSKSKIAPWFGGSLVLAGFALGGWFLIHKNAARFPKTQDPAPSTIIVKTLDPQAAVTRNSVLVETATPPPATPPKTIEDQVDHAAPIAPKVPTAPLTNNADPKPPTPPKKPTATNTTPDRPTGKPATPPVKPTPPPEVQVFNAADQRILVGQEGKRVAVDGTCEEITFSRSKETMYLVFLKNKRGAFRAAIVVKDAKPDLSEAAMKSLLGKKVRVTGTIKIETPNRPIIRIDNRNAIQLTK